MVVDDAVLLLAIVIVRPVILVDRDLVWMSEAVRGGFQPPVGVIGLERVSACDGVGTRSLVTVVVLV